jgi:hypothetical protein
MEWTGAGRSCLHFHALCPVPLGPSVRRLRTHYNMLDLKHPQTQWIFDASREEDAILSFAKLMTLVPTPQRQQLLPRIARPIARLRRLNHEHFGGSSFIERAISDLEAGCQSIASLQSTESRLDGHGTCPVCASTIKHLPEYHDMTYCSHCLSKIDDARERLASSEAFGTWAI